MKMKSYKNNGYECGDCGGYGHFIMKKVVTIMCE